MYSVLINTIVYHHQNAKVNPEVIVRVSMQSSAKIPGEKLPMQITKPSSCLGNFMASTKHFNFEDCGDYKFQIPICLVTVLFDMSLLQMNF